MRIDVKSVKVPDINGAVLSLLETYGELEGFVFLDSGGASLSGRHLFFLEPIGRFNSWTEIDLEHKRLTAKCNSMQLSEEIPLLVGYLSYELLHELECVPAPPISSYNLPLTAFYRYRKVVEIPCDSSKSARIISITEDSHDPIWVANDLESKLIHPTYREISWPIISSQSADITLESLSNFSYQEYLSAIRTIQDQITAGEVYQVNLSQQFRAPFRENPALLYRKLREEFSASYGAYIRTAGTSILSSSPELFVSARNGVVTSSPIKGTRRRGPDTDSDRKLLQDLLGSKKDLAELAMIVDLIRNDLGKVAKLGSVRVAAHARHQAYEHLHHLISDIECELLDQVSPISLAKALFPCGSITGCPKIAAMKVISKLEGRTRGVYTGAIGWIGAGQNLELNVAIRTGVVAGDEFIFQAGGGIVIDSVPEDEFQETILKARPLWRAYLAVTSYDSDLSKSERDTSPVP